MSGGPWQDDSDSSTYMNRVLGSLKDRGVEVYAVGVGPGTSASQMSGFSSGRRYWFLSNSYDDLQYVRPRLIRSIQGSKYRQIILGNFAGPIICRRTTCKRYSNIFSKAFNVFCNFKYLSTKCNRVHLISFFNMCFTVVMPADSSGMFLYEGFTSHYNGLMSILSCEIVAL